MEVVGRTALNRPTCFSDTLSLYDSDAARQPNKEKDEPKLLKLSDADLAEYTNNFHQDNLIGSTQFCKLYRGKFNAQDVTIKIWDGKQFGVEYPDDYIVMLQEEVTFFMDTKVNHHLSLPKLIGYCSQEQVTGVVYDLNPRDSLHNLITQGDQ